ncbi:MAG: tryptophan--tRNA ligase [Flavobacterium sp.]|nr:tryptophan--tRNA ligase [Flavobacterium sp.]
MNEIIKVNNRKRILTGDRPTGPLHLGHYVGSLANRVKLQDEYEQYILIADVQAMTDNFEDPEKVAKNVIEVAIDYLSVGIDPKKTSIVLQSQIPELFEMSMYFMNLVTVSELERNPTVKEEIKKKEFSGSVPVGFFVYPISQAADILGFNADLVPVGEDQSPMLEQAREIGRNFNRIYGELFIMPQGLISNFPRLMGIDGKQKMSKTLGNTIDLSESSESLKKKVMKMYTDPGRIHATDPGKVEGNPVFTYLDAFSNNKEQNEELKRRYREGSIKDVEVKEILYKVLEDFLKPIRKKRKFYERNKKLVEEIIKEGTNRGRKVVAEIMKEMRDKMKIKSL